MSGDVFNSRRDFQSANNTVVYSICMTNYNTVNSVRQSLESLFKQMDERFEIIVVDNQSSDGSLDILRHYEKTGKIKLIVRHCSRGLGRQIGVRNSKGKYIISQMDMDDVFEPYLSRILENYHASFEGYLLLIQGQPGMFIAPKELIEAVGGYRDLNYFEDRDLYSRVAQIGRFRFLKKLRIIAYTIHNPSMEYRLLVELRESYINTRERFRTGLGPESLALRVFWRTVHSRNPLWVIYFSGFLVIVILAFIVHWFYPRFRNRSIRFFNKDDYIV